MYISIPYCCCLQFILLSCVSKLANKFTVQLKSFTRNILKCVNYKFYCSSMLDICVDRMARYVGTVQFISLLNVYRNWCFMGFTGNFSFWIYSKLSLWDHYFDVLEWRESITTFFIWKRAMFSVNIFGRLLNAIWITWGKTG